MKADYSEYEMINNKLRQHEQTITQLLAIIAASNQKICELYKRQMTLEQHFKFPPCSSPRSSAEEGSPDSTITPQVKE